MIQVSRVGQAVDPPGDSPRHPAVSLRPALAPGTPTQPCIPDEMTRQGAKGPVEANLNSKATLGAIRLTLDAVTENPQAQSDGSRSHIAPPGPRCKKLLQQPGVAARDSFEGQLQARQVLAAPAEGALGGQSPIIPPSSAFRHDLRFRLKKAYASRPMWRSYMRLTDIIARSLSCAVFDE